MRYLFLLLLFPLFAEITHTVNLESGPLTYTAAVETGEVSAISYIKSDQAGSRPITFVFNGGPGSSSVWLHIAAFGPRRALCLEEGQRKLPPYKLTDNLETILDLTDLVFIDPPGTGFSSDDSNAYSIKADIESVGKFIRDYLTKANRWNSPKYIAGESYGATRAIGLADYLQDEFGIYPSGLILISAAIDFQTFIFDEDNPLPYFLYLPTYAATAWVHGLLEEKNLETVIEKARDFAYQTYAPALICRSCWDQEKINEELSQLTSLPLDLIEKCRGRIDEGTFLKELLAEKGMVVGTYDSRMCGYSENIFQDPSFCLINSIVSGAFNEYLYSELGVANFYTIFSKMANERWNFRDYNPWGYPNLMGALRRALQRSPSMKLFVGCGLYDLATPFATVEYCFDHLELPEVSLHLEYYEGGHMYYLNPSALKKFKQDLIQFYKEDYALSAFDPS